jgi:hypothetical protein
MNKKNALFVMPGNCRTFMDCFDSCYENVISKLFTEEYNVYVYLYLKLKDPGPKGQWGWNFSYKDIEHDTLINKINEFKNKYTNLNFDYKIITDNEISDSDLLSQVKNRSLYINFFSENSKLLRGLHCHYNLECCGKYILEKEESLNITFDYLVYIRPDLYFTSPSNSIDKYSDNIITLGYGPIPYENCKSDHYGIIPRKNMESFFFSKINIYRNNTTQYFSVAEEIWYYDMKYEYNQIGTYYIKRE